MKHGWAFFESLTLAIEAWSAAVAKRYPQAFVHLGMDLRHAVERDLFFTLVNDPVLQERFDARMDGATLPPAPFDPWRAAIEPYLIQATSADAQIPPLKPFSRWRNRVGNMLRLGKPAFATGHLASAPDILFLCIHPKFVDFFKPVAESAGAGAAFLTVNDLPLEGHLYERGLARVGLRPTHFSLPAGPLLRHYAHFCGILESFSAMMEALKPRLIVVPEGNAPVYELALLAGRKKGIATICVQHGAPAYTNPGFRNWHFDNVLVWGDAFIDPFARHNPGQAFTVAGTPAQLPHPVEVGGAPIRSIGFFLQKGATVVPAAEWEALLEFIGWTAREFPGLKVIVRDHPSQPHLTPAERAHLDGLANITFMSPPRISLNDALAACDVVVASASTTLLEAVQSGGIPFIFGTAYPADFPDIAAAGAAASAPDLPSAKTLLARLAQDSEWRMSLHHAGKRLRPHLFAAVGHEGAARIAALLRAASG
jgi:hypothetical protein